MSIWRFAWRGVWAGCVALVPLAGHTSDDPPARDPGIQILVPFDETLSMALPHPDGERMLATVVVHEGSVLAGTQGDPVTLDAFASADDLWRGEIGLILMDIDFDGYLDIGVLDGVGYGGVNHFYRFWRADAQAQYVPVGVVSNPEADNVTGTVRSASRSGPFWTTDEYRVEGDRFLLVYTRQQRGEYDRVTFAGVGKGNAVEGIIPTVAPDPPFAEALEQPAFHQTALATAARVYFHDAPEEASRRAAYLVEGDIARVLDVSEDEAWMRVSFTHGTTGRTTSGWLPVGPMVFVQG